MQVGLVSNLSSTKLGSLVRSAVVSQQKKLLFYLLVLHVFRVTCNLCIQFTFFLLLPSI